MDTMSDDADPTRFGNFETERFLGGGSFGRVFLAYRKDDPKKRNPVAIKWMLEQTDETALARFENEKWALQNIDHPAFPKFVSSGSVQKRPFIVMDFAEGRTIGKRIAENVRNQTFFSGLGVLLIAQRLLEALKYLDNRDLIHCDIKDENVIVSSSGEDVTLIDLGLCNGIALPEQNLNFWQEGAARFAPPVKLHSPAASNISHDVFAVGVLCYRMLTNNYPWEVKKDKDFGDLRNEMLTKNPVAIQEVNSAPVDRICGVIMQMLVTHDHLRITLDLALNEIKSLRETLESDALPAISKGPPLRLSRVVRDPVHGDIQMTDLEFAVLNCKEIQRLRRIRQLGTTHLVYPGAEHSRLSHAIGVVHVVERVLRSIEMREGFSFCPEDRWMVRMAALTHDVAHAPFGHTLEDELGFFARHDRNTARLDRLFSRPDAELPTILEASEVGRAAIDLLYGKTRPTRLGWIESFLSGPVGADVLDYVDRDSFYCGLDRRIDSALYRRFTIDRRSPLNNSEREIVPRLFGNHGARHDAEHEVLSVLEARYELFLKVYSHSVKTAAGAMIGKALALAIQSAPLVFQESTIEVMGDEELLAFLDGRGPDSSQHLIGQYRDRKLFRPAYRAMIMQSSALTLDNYNTKRKKLDREGLFDPIKRLDIEKEIAGYAGVNCNKIAIYVSNKAPGAKSVSLKVEETRGSIRTRDGTYARYQDIFNLHLNLWNIYLFVDTSISKENRARLAVVMASKFDLSDELNEDRIQLALGL